MRIKMTGAAIAAVGILATGGVAGAAQAPSHHARPTTRGASGRAAHIDLIVPSKPFAFLPGELPAAGGSVVVRTGKTADRITVRVHDLPANADYVVFLTQTAGAPFGAVQYIGDLTTNRHGVATVHYRTIAFNAFAFANAGPTGTPAPYAHTNLDYVGVWPAETTTLDFAFLGQPTPAGGVFNAAPSTPFDDDGVAAPAILTSDPTKPSPLTR